MKLDSIGWNHNNNNYKKEIIKYFTSSISEMNALIYSNRIAPSETSLEWYEWILKNKKINQTN